MQCTLSIEWSRSVKLIISILLHIIIMEYGVLLGYKSIQFRYLKDYNKENTCIATVWGRYFGGFRFL